MSAEAESKLVAVIVNYRTPELTIDCARGLVSLPGRRPDRVIVVDNGSTDGSFPLLQRALPFAEVVDAGRNLGFGGGTNVGIRRALVADAKRVLIVNSDAKLDPGCIEALQQAMEDPAAGIVGPVIVAAKTGRTESRGISLVPATGRVLLSGAGQSLPSAESPPEEVSALSGCVMLIARAVVESVGLFDELYFYGFEDLDLCLRTRKQGYRCYCIPAARALHNSSATIGRASAARYYFAARNHLRLVRALESRPASPLALARAAAVTAYNVAHALRPSRTPRVAALRATTLGVIDYLRDRYGPAPERL